jgi:AAA domain
MGREAREASLVTVERVTLDDFNTIPTRVKLPSPLPQNGYPAPQEREGEKPAAVTEPFAGRSHAEVLALEFEEERQLVTDLIPAGAVGLIAGLPETHKSFLAQAIVVRVGRGEGEILGHQVAAQAPAGYFWQDDSTREEAERVKLYEQAHSSPPDLPVRWFLNEGLELPRDLERLRATIERFGLRLAVLDSFYNVALVDVKDREAGKVVAALKAQVCDPTGCTVLIVDHMPWATDSNRLRLRSYGDVFKGAAARFGIYIDAESKKLWVEARGNNIRGFKRTPAYWDEEVLELRLVEVAQVEAEELDARVLEYVSEHPGESQKRVEDQVEGGRDSIRKSLERLASHLLLATGPGRAWNGKYWYPADHAALRSPGDLLASDGEQAPGLSQGQSLAGSPLPRRGGEPSGEQADSGELEADLEEDVPF